MGQKKSACIIVEVHGVGYKAFSRVKWQQFLRIFSGIVLALVILALVLAAMGRLPRDLPLSVGLVAVLLVLAVLALCRSAIRREYRQSGLSAMALKYTFDRDGWTVRSQQGQVTVPWSKTYRLRRTDQALMLYPNRKSVNLVPLEGVSPQQVQQIVAWCTGRQA